MIVRFLILLVTFFSFAADGQDFSNALRIAQIADGFYRHIKHEPCSHATGYHFLYATKTKKP